VRYADVGSDELAAIPAQLIVSPDQLAALALFDFNQKTPILTRNGDYIDPSLQSDVMKKGMSRLKDGRLPGLGELFELKIDLVR